MARNKAVSHKVTKSKLKSSIIKRKSTKNSTPILKKLTAKQVKETLVHKSPPASLNILKVEDSVQSENNSNLNENVGQLIKAPGSCVDRDQVSRGVKALFEYIAKTADNKVELFDDEQPLFLQITAVKVPKTPTRQVRLLLKHSLLSEDSEICLIVKDIGKPKDYDETIEHYQKLLVDNDITNIKTIMPYHQFKSEYGKQYELKRKLVGLYDHFVVDGRISGYVAHLLGKIFLEKRKLPTSIHMNASNLKDEVGTALKKTILKMHSKGDSYAVQIGHSKMTKEEVLNNVCEAIDELVYKFPGGLDNIRQLGLKTEKSLFLPIYLTLKKKNIVEVPVVRSKRPKQFKSETGELTTYLHRDVTVLPSGKVVCINKQKTKKVENKEIDEPVESDTLQEEDEDDMEFYVDDEDLSDLDSLDKDEEDIEQEVKVDNNENKENQDFDDNDLVQAEQMYLNEYEKTKVKKSETKAEVNLKQSKTSKRAKQGKVQDATNEDQYPKESTSQVVKERKTKKGRKRPMKTDNIDENSSAKKSKQVLKEATSESAGKKKQERAQNKRKQTKVVNNLESNTATNENGTIQIVESVAKTKKGKKNIKNAEASQAVKLNGIENKQKTKKAKAKAKIENLENPAMKNKKMPNDKVKSVKDSNNKTGKSAVAQKEKKAKNAQTTENTIKSVKSKKGQKTAKKL